MKYCSILLVGSHDYWFIGYYKKNDFACSSLEELGNKRPHGAMIYTFATFLTGNIDLDQDLGF